MGIYLVTKEICLEKIKRIQFFEILFFYKVSLRSWISYALIDWYSIIYNIWEIRKFSKYTFGVHLLFKLDFKRKLMISCICKRLRFYFFVFQIALWIDFTFNCKVLSRPVFRASLFKLHYFLSSVAQVLHYSIVNLPFEIIFFY